MNIKNLREWLDNLPTDFDEHQVVFRTVEKLDEDYWSALDRPIISCGIDDENSEAFFMDKNSADVIEKQ